MGLPHKSPKNGFLMRQLWFLFWSVYMVYAFLIFLEIVFPVILLIYDNKRSFKAALVMKTLSSLVFVAMGFYAAKRGTPGNFRTLILCGLILGAAGDVLLSLRHCLHEKISVFLIGGSVFFIGHVCYLTALITDLRTGASRLLWPGILAALLASGILVSLLLRRIRIGKTMSFLCGGYMCAVTSMAVLGIFRFIASPGDAGRILFMAGGIFFAASDTILVDNMFAPSHSQKKAIALILLYYAGQLMIAMSLGF